MKGFEAMPQKSIHFTLYELADGVYAVVANPHGAAFSNSGIIDLGDQVLVLDAMDTPTAALDLRQAAERLTGKEVSFVILSHNHFDHRGGVQVFDPNTTILSTNITREIILEEESDPDFNIEDELRELEESRVMMTERLQSESDERWKENLGAAISRLNYFIEAVPGIKIRYPNLTYNSKLTFHGRRRTVDVIHAGMGHTKSDSWLFLPQENIAFIADLGFFQSHPFMDSSYPDNWVSILGQFEDSNIVNYVPGHGPVGTITDVMKVKEYILSLQEQVAQVIDRGGSEEDAAAAEMPPIYEEWVYGINRYETNMRFLYKAAMEDQNE